MGLGKTTWFPHRHNRNGSWDSIYVVCFATVATAVVEAELSAEEAAHVCDPGRRESSYDTTSDDRLWAVKTPPVSPPVVPSRPQPAARIFLGLIFRSETNPLGVPYAQRQTRRSPNAHVDRKADDQNED
jgi:hypothetical protein